MPNLTAILIILGVALVGAIIYRWRGGGQPEGWGKYMPRPIDQTLFSLPYIGLAFYFLPWWPAAILSFVTVALVSKGHGRNMDLGNSDATHPDAKPEYYEGLISGLYGKISNYWYDALGLVISGLTYTLPVGLFLANPAGPYFWEGLALALSGALKAPAYMLGRWLDTKTGLDEYLEPRLYKVVRLDGATSWGEFFTGLFLWGFAVALFLFYLVTPSAFNL